jgi:hypothetical protein
MDDYVSIGKDQNLLVERLCMSSARRRILLIFSDVPLTCRLHASGKFGLEQVELLQVGDVLANQRRRQMRNVVVCTRTEGLDGDPEAISRHSRSAHCFRGVPVGVQHGQHRVLPLLRGQCSEWGFEPDHPLIVIVDAPNWAPGIDEPVHELV